VYGFLFDKDFPYSVISSLGNAYDNAIVLREVLSSQALSYIQMALNVMENAALGLAPMLDLQGVQDYLYAFRGCSDDSILDRHSRYTLKVGSTVERIDMYVRLDYHTDTLDEEFARLQRRLQYTPMRRDGKPENRYSLIQTDGVSSCGTPSYWVEKMFADNLPVRIIPVSCPEVHWLQPAGVDKKGWFYNRESRAIDVVSLHAGAGVAHGEVIVKLVNARWDRQPIALAFAAPLPAGTVSRLTLAAAPDAVNTPREPSRVKPVADTVSFAGGKRLELDLPPCSVTVLRMKK
jgi:hypothetical protein